MGAQFEVLFDLYLPKRLVGSFRLHREDVLNAAPVDSDVDLISFNLQPIWQGGT